MPTRAQIINHMLRVLGEGGVSYDQALHPTVQTCNDTLDTVNEEEQGKGWWFNREIALKLVPDNRGQIILPTNTLDMRLTDVDRWSVSQKNRYTFRDGMVYDMLDHTFDLTDAVYVDCIVLLDVDHLPQPMQNYIQHKAAETVFLNGDGDTQKLTKLERRTALAWQTLQAANLKNISVNAHDRTSVQVLNSGWRPSISGRNPNYIGGRVR